MKKKQLIIGVTGASGAIYATRLLRALNNSNITCHIIISNIAESILKQECDWNISKEKLPDYFDRVYNEKNFELETIFHSEKNMYASIASGSFKTDGMVVLPCSMKTLASISNGLTSSLIDRAADVVLKERRKLILLTREMPLNRIHIENMLKAHDAGAIIMPASPAFYLGQTSMNELVDFVIGRILNLFDIEHKLFKPWGTSEQQSS